MIQRALYITTSPLIVTDTARTATKTRLGCQESVTKPLRTIVRKESLTEIGGRTLLIPGFLHLLKPETSTYKWNRAFQKAVSRNLK